MTAFLSIRSLNLVLCASALSLAFSACGNSSDVQPASNDPRRQAAAAADQPTAAANNAPVAQGPTANETMPQATVEDPSYQLRAEVTPTYGTGSEQTASIVLQAKGEYHINDTYPMRVTFDEPPTGLTLPVRELEKSAATTFERMRAVFPVKFTAGQANRYRLVAHVDFAVCTETTCLPEQRSVLVEVNAQ